MPGTQVTVRPAGPADVAAIAAVDPVASHDDDRRRFIAERGFVVMLCVHPERRRRGIGQALMRHAEVACRTQRIFASTNRSNLPMQRLLEGLGYRCSGMVDDLDPGDPELFYSRWLGDRT